MSYHTKAMCLTTFTYKVDTGADTNV